jgi:hypothetical protein
MKNIFYLAFLTLFLCACGSGDVTDIKVHTNKQGDQYCSYSAQGAGSGTFTICMYCPQGSAQCGTLKRVRILRKGHWFTPNEYDVFDLTPTPGWPACNVCEGSYYWEKL